MLFKLFFDFETQLGNAVHDFFDDSLVHDALNCIFQTDAVLVERLDWETAQNEGDYLDGSARVRVVHNILDKSLNHLNFSLLIIVVFNKLCEQVAHFVLIYLRNLVNYFFLIVAEQSQQTLYLVLLLVLNEVHENYNCLLQLHLVANCVFLQFKQKLKVT